MPTMSRRQVAEATISKDRVSMKKKNGGSNAMNPAISSPQRRQSNSSSRNNLDLLVIDNAFGKHSDLYEDVLQVAMSATQEEIQLAYFDRRSELFTLLAKIDSKPQSDAIIKQRYKAERKMDCVVLAVRVLGDPTLRAAYNRLRPERLNPPTSQQTWASPSRRQASPRLVTPTAAVTPPSTVMDDSNSDIYDSSTMEDSTNVVPMDNIHQVPLEERRKRNLPKRESSKKLATNSHSSASSSSSKGYKKKRRPHDSPSNKDNDDRLKPSTSKDADTECTDDLSNEDVIVVAPTTQRGKVQNLIEDNLSVAMESRQEDDTLAAETMDTISTTEKDGHQNSAAACTWFSGSRMLRKVADEISGAFEDTLVSVDQVFNAFTLTDKDIKAVTKKIHKAKRQLDN